MYDVRRCLERISDNLSTSSSPQWGRDPLPNPQGNCCRETNLLAKYTLNDFYSDPPPFSEPLAKISLSYIIPFLSTKAPSPTFYFKPVEVIFGMSSTCPSAGIIGPCLTRYTTGQTVGMTVSNFSPVCAAYHLDHQHYSSMLKRVLYRCWQLWFSFRSWWYVQYFLISNHKRWRVASRKTWFEIFDIRHREEARSYERIWIFTS